LREPSHSEVQQTIALQTEDFLRLGGTIQQVANGVSGQVWKPVKPLSKGTT
jgi:hypothetical protein